MTPAIQHDHRLPIVAIAVCLLIGWWFVTGSTGHPFKPYDLILPTFYDALGEALLQGRLDVPCEVLRNEVFIVDGRCYQYLGFTPALLRLPLNALLPQYRGHWAGLSVFAAFALTLVSAYALVLTIHDHVLKRQSSGSPFGTLTATYLTALGLGGTSVFLLGRPVIHHEAIIWGSALGVASLVFTLRYIFLGSRAALFAAVLLAFLAIHARAPAGLTAAVACIVGAIAPPLLRGLQSNDNVRGFTAQPALGLSAAILAVTLSLAAVASHFAVGYAKFGTFEGVPLRYHKQSDPALEKLLHGTLFHPQNLRWNLDKQFGLEGLTSSDSPPYFRVHIRMQGEASPQEERSRYPEARIGGLEPFVSITVGMTALLVMTLIGFLFAMKPTPSRTLMVLLLGTTLAGPLAISTFAYVSYRYFHEYTLLFALGGAIAICHLSLGSGTMTKALGALLALLVAANVAINTHFTLRYQTSVTNLGAPILDMQETIDRLPQWLRLGSPVEKSVRG